MINSRYHTERMSNGKKIIIDIAKNSNTSYEVMVLQKSTGLELAAEWCDDLESAVLAYQQMLDDFPESGAPLGGQYAKLRDDLKVALKAGKDAEKADPVDGGACNFDSAALNLPRWNSAKVQQAAEEAGSRCFEWKLFGMRYFVFRPNTHAQGNARSRNAETMTMALKSMGYDAVDYCQMD